MELSCSQYSVMTPGGFHAYFANLRHPAGRPDTLLDASHMGGMHGRRAVADAAGHLDLMALKIILKIMLKILEQVSRHGCGIARRIE